MKKKIKERELLWKRLFTQGCENVDEHSKWFDILKKQGLCCKENYWRLADKISQAAIECGAFSEKEKAFLNLLPGYKEIMWFLTTQRAPESCFEEQISAYVKVACRCYSDCSGGIPIVECTILTDEPAPLRAELYVFVASGESGVRKHGIIRFKKSSGKKSY